MLSRCNASLKGNSSQGGFIKFLHRNEKLFSPIAWKSMNIKHIVKSTFSAGMLALGQVLECFIMKSFLCEMLKKKISNEILSKKLFVDNKSFTDKHCCQKEIKNRYLHDS